MAEHLKRPSAPHRISELPFHEPMRMTWKGEPIVSMCVGNRSKEPRLLVFKKDGSIDTIMDPWVKTHELVFIDYLLEDESVTIHGSALERSDEADLGPDPTKEPYENPLPKLMIGDSDYRQVPDFVPFIAGQNRAEHARLCILIRNHPHSMQEGVQYGAIVTCTVESDIAKGQQAGWDHEMYGRADRYFEDTYPFQGYVGREALEAFRRHHMVRDHWDFLKANNPAFPKSW